MRDATTEARVRGAILGDSGASGEGVRRRGGATPRGCRARGDAPPG